MGRTGIVVWVLAAAAIAAINQRQVIAGLAVIDQPASIAGESNSQPDSIAPITTPMRRGFTGWDAVIPLLAIGVVSVFIGMGWHRLANSPRRSSSVLPGFTLPLIVAFLLLSQFGFQAAGIIFKIDPSSSTTSESLSDQAKLLLGAYAGQTIALVLYLMLYLPAARVVGSVRPSIQRSVGVGIGATLFFWPVVLFASTIAALIQQAITGQEADNIAHKTLRLFVDSPVDGWYVTMTCLALFVAPVMEETLYRGLIQNTMVQLGLPRWPAILLTSAVFALMHGDIASPHALAGLFVLSIFLGWLYERSGRLAAPIAMHVTFNVANLAVALLMARH